MKALIEKYRKEISTLRKGDKYLDEDARSLLFGKIDTLEDVISDLENLQSKGKMKSVEGSDVLSFLSNSKRQFAKECGCERCLEILSIHEREEYAQSPANQDGWVSVEKGLPEPLERVLVYATDVALLCFGVAFYNGKYFQFDATMINRSTHFEKVSDKRILPTHWQPLPPKPQI